MMDEIIWEDMYRAETQATKELERDVERLEELIRHIYVHGTMLTRDQHEIMLGWKVKGENT